MTINESMAQRASSTRPACPYCFTTVDGEAVTCPACGATHHADCYAESGACAVHGCAESAERRHTGQPVGSGSVQQLPPPSGAASGASYPPPSGAASGASYPPPSAAAPVSSYPPPSGGAPAASYPPPTGGRGPESAGPAHPGWQPYASAPAPVGGAGTRRVVVGGTASATIYRGKLLVATSDGVQYEFQL